MLLFLFALLASSIISLQNASWMMDDEKANLKGERFDSSVLFIALQGISKQGGLNPG